MSKVWKFGDHVDTDQIVPGRYAPYMRPDDDVANAAFVEAHPEFNQKACAGDIIVAGKNFGCGSSREYAPLALKRRNVGAIIARSFARIFFRNAINLGIPIFECDAAASRLEDGDEVSLDLKACTLGRNEELIELPKLPDFARAIIESGGIVKYVKKFGRFPTA